MTMRNICYIDGQNLLMSTLTSPFALKIDVRLFLPFLQQKYKVSEAHYFVGKYEESKTNFYKALKKSGFSVDFREHNYGMISNKKGNVDTDIVFEMMRTYSKRKDFDKIILVSGDGDYYRTVKFLIEEQKFSKILLPSHENASWLYKKLDPQWFTYLDYEPTRKKLKKIVNAGPT
ncbi:MAG: NYN domain-containing protein [Bifidobacteriaceae bacterium]|jgi:uncharacterized LabA/DUF88 family protein|nr:NYN domain-containing protein [Bifidobacteriaceae bacterium]